MNNTDEARLVSYLMSQLEEGSELVSQGNYESAKTKLNLFFAEVHKLEGISYFQVHQDEKAELLLNALYLRSASYAFSESLQKALDIIYSAPEILNSPYLHPDSVAKKNIQTLLDGLESFEDKSVFVPSDPPSSSQKVDATPSYRDYGEGKVIKPITSGKGQQQSQKPSVNLDWVPSGIVLLISLPVLLLLLVPVIFWGIALLSNPVTWVIIIVILVICCWPRN